MAAPWMSRRLLGFLVEEKRGRVTYGVGLRRIRLLVGEDVDSAKEEVGEGSWPACILHGFAIMLILWICQYEKAVDEVCAETHEISNQRAGLSCFPRAVFELCISHRCSECVNVGSALEFCMLDFAILATFSVANSNESCRFREQAEAVSGAFILVVVAT